LVGDIEASESFWASEARAASKLVLLTSVEPWAGAALLGLVKYMAVRATSRAVRKNFMSVVVGSRAQMTKVSNSKTRGTSQHS
jgi:hypothetical protein